MFLLATLISRTQDIVYSFYITEYMYMFYIQSFEKRKGNK